MSHEMRVANGEMEAVQTAVEFAPYDMPEVVVVHGPNTSGQTVAALIESTGIIKTPYSIRTFTDTHPNNNIHNSGLSEHAFGANHLLVDRALLSAGAQDSDLAELSQGFSSAPHTTWLFEGDSVTQLLWAAGYNRNEVIRLSTLDEELRLADPGLSLFDRFIAYGEKKLGYEYLYPKASLPAQIDNMDPVIEEPLSREQWMFIMRTALAMGKSAVANVMHPVNTVRSALEAAAGSEYPTRDSVKALVAGDCDTQNEIDYEVRWRRRKWWKDLKHRNGLTQALQQGETR